LQISLRYAQGLVYNDPTRFKVLVTGRRFGKTYLILVTLLTKAAETPNGTFFYTALTYQMAKDLAWDLLKFLTPKEWLKKKPNETELKITLINGAQISLKGIDRPDTLVGRGLDGVALDECALYPDDAAWRVTLRPSLADKQGWALFATTVRRGFRALWFLEIYEKAQKGMPGWSAWTFTTLEGENVPEEEIEMAKADMDEKTFNQEFLAKLEDEDGRVAVSFSDLNIQEVEDDDTLPLYVGIDFNVDPFCAVVAVKRPVEQFDGSFLEELHIFDEIELRDATTWDMGEVLNERFGGNDRIIRGFPDPTGNARRTNAVGGTDHTILRRCGITVITPGKPYRIRDKITAINTAWCNALKQRRAKINPRCKETIKSMRLLMYDEKTGLPDKTQGLDHFFDCTGYLMLGCFNLLQPEALGTSNLKIYGREQESGGRINKFGPYSMTRPR
jgi:hypothetical protein